MSSICTDELDKMHICCSTDDNYAKHCGVMLCSLFENNEHATFDIHILISDLSDDNLDKLRSLIKGYKSECHFYTIESDVLKGVKYRENRPLTEAAYYRILMSSILDESVVKVLYLDSDIIVNGDLTHLFSIDISEYALAATKDLAEMTDERRFQLSLPYNEPYFCSGIMLINLDFWRKNDSEKALIEFSKRDRKVFNHDQDALNAVFSGKWFQLSPKWNRFFPDFYENSFFETRADRHAFEQEPVIIHFSGHFKPWNNIKWVGLKWRRYKNLYYKYLEISPWKPFKQKKVRVHKYGLYKFLIINESKFIYFNLRKLFSKLSEYFEWVLFLPLRVYFKFF